MNAQDNVVRLDKRMPNREEVQSAAQALTAIQNGRDDDGTIEIAGVRLSAALTDHVEMLFGIIARGDTVTIMPLQRTLTTQQAADLLNVSRSHFIKMVDAGEIGVEMVGTHRKVVFEELIALKEKRSKARRQALAEIQQLGEEYDAT